MLAANDSQRWGHVILGVVIPDYAVALALAYVARERERRSWRRPHNGGNCTVVARWPSELGEIVTGEDGRTSVNETAS